MEYLGLPGVEESVLVSRRALWCGGEHLGVKDSALVWMRAT